MEERDRISVRVVYALPERQVATNLTVPSGSTVAQAIAASGLMQKFPELAARPLNCAVFGRAVTLDQTLISGDRVEILRPLLVDPKEGRRQSAAEARSSARLRVR
jgi:hypothetical protein